MKLTCPKCGREHPLTEPYPLPNSRLPCACGRSLVVMYPPGAVDEMRRKGLRFEGDPTASAPTNPFEAAAAPHGGFWRAGIDDEATSLFTPSQMEEVNRALQKGPSGPPPARPGPPPVPKPAPALRGAASSISQRPVRPAPDLRAIPDHGQTGLFPIMDVPELPRVGPPAPTPPKTFEEEPTAMFMAEEDVKKIDLRTIPDHGQTGLIVSMRSLPPASPAATRPPTPAPLVSFGPPLRPGAPTEAPEEPVVVAVPRPISPLAALSPAASAAPARPTQPPTDAARPPRSGASLEQIQRLRVSTAAQRGSPLSRMPGWLLWVLVAMTAGGVALLFAAFFLWLKT